MGRPKINGICIVDGCGRDATSLQMCHPHYMRVRKHGDPQADKPILERDGRPYIHRICSYPTCEKHVQARELCAGHLSQLNRGQELQPLAVQLFGRICEYPDCGRPHASSGYCAGHADQLRSGRPLAPLRKVAPKGSGTINNNGYRVVGGRLEHRVVMEQKLNRPLLPDETVHHVNGIRTDNDPDNLELWVSRHPSGQRVENILAWAHEMIARYETE